MTSPGAYEGEMGRFLRLSDEELSRLLAGEAGARDEALDEVGSLLDEVRGVALASAPDENTRERHLAAILETSQLIAEKGTPAARPGLDVRGPVATPGSEVPTWRRVMDRSVGTAVKVFAGALAASLSMVGLAFAGVDLPGQAAERALEAVTGLELPNQNANEHAAKASEDRAAAGSDNGSAKNSGDKGEHGKSSSDAVHAVIDGDLEGCEKGQAVAAAASANRNGDGGSDNDPCDKNSTAGSKSNGEEKSSEGRANAAEKSDGRSEARGSSEEAKANGKAGGPSGSGREHGKSEQTERGKSSSAPGQEKGNGKGQGNKYTE